MPRGYRCVILAAFGWLATAALQPEQSASRPQADSKKQVAKPPPPATRRPAFKPLDSAKYNPPCRDPKDNERCDLEAQWKAADAADKAAWWAVIQAILSAAGIIGLVVSLYYTRKAVLAAESATKDADTALALAERNADAATDQVRLMRDNSENELRPWLDFELFIEHSKVAEHGLEFTAKLEITNYGKTPAQRVMPIIRTRNAETGTQLEMDVPEFQDWSNPNVLFETVFPNRTIEIATAQSFQRGDWILSPRGANRENSYFVAKIIVNCCYYWPGGRGKTAKVFWIRTYPKAETNYETAIESSLIGDIALQATGMGPKLYD